MSTVSNKIYSVIVNAVVSKDNKILLSQRSLNEAHEPGKWTIPGGKIENANTEEEIKNIIEKTCAREVMEEVDVEIEAGIKLIANNTFRRSNGQMVLALVFLCKYKGGEAKALEDTNAVTWVTQDELDNYNFPPNVRQYIEAGFAELKKRR